MIRIDEIYEHTFWPWLTKNSLNNAMMYHHPFGETSLDSLKVLIDEEKETKHFFHFFDQEPVHLDLHSDLFSHAHDRMRDTKKAIITSEFNSDDIKQLCNQYDMTPFYYFFHGWAALDWFRGYDKTFLMPPPDEREIKKTFISPNRIIGVKRLHRVILLYWFRKYNLLHNHISCPEVCPSTNINIKDIARWQSSKYPDILEVLDDIDFPLTFDGELTPSMDSYKLTLQNPASECLLYNVNETIWTGKKQFLTEKIFKPICFRMPFVLSSTAGSLEYLKRYGFKTFNSLWDESYDQITDNHQRLSAIAELLWDLDNLSRHEMLEIHKFSRDIVEHNYQHFYSGDFEAILTKEFTQLLGDFHDFTK